ncbi:MAG: stage IV sporulation protein A [Oscillospiraceae bacterium]|nr:stage IV sporulation protein A [Oscillospiraceae bacterium]
MSDMQLYKDLAERTGGSFLLGVVGPVRTGKSTFIKRFMETLVIPNIENQFARERAKDELPQSGSGKTIMTAEPKFVPEEAAQIRLADETEMSVRLIDCVGYMVEGAAGQFEDGSERMVTTPWFDHEVTMTEAAERGTEQVIREHSSIGIVVTTDGSFGEIPREMFVEPEARVIQELKGLGKPFTVIINSAAPQSPEAVALAAQIREQYGVNCLCVNCLNMDEDDVSEILHSVMEEFPVSSIGFFLPDWVDALPDSNELKRSVYALLMENAGKANRLKDLPALMDQISQSELVSAVESGTGQLDRGGVSIHVQMPRSLYYQTLSQETGLSIESDGDLISTLSSMAAIRDDYEKIRNALDAVRTTGYGVVFPDNSEMELEEPQIVRQNGKYSVRLRAKAPAIHMMMTRVETEVSPAIGGENASEDIINFLLQGFDGEVNRIWESNIFGRSLNELAGEGLHNKIENLPENARRKLRDTLQRIINEGCSGLICILL